MASKTSAHLAKTGYTNVEPAPSTACERAGVHELAQHNTAATIREGKGWCTKGLPTIRSGPDRWSSALARSRRRSGRSDARLAAELQTRWRFSGELLRVVFFNRTNSRWLFERWPLARSADDVACPQRGWRGASARMSHHRVSARP